MKNLILLSFFLSCFLSYGQIVNPESYSLKFTYDNAGNQSKRELICLGLDCDDPVVSGRISQVSTKEDGLIKSSEHPEFSYYPNPVEHELFLKWQNIEDGKVNTISVFSMSGQLMGNHKNLSQLESLIISFNNFPQGMYNLIVEYNSGDKKTFKVLKK